MTDEIPADPRPPESKPDVVGYGYEIDDLRAENGRLREGLEQMQADVLRLSRALEPMYRLNELLAKMRAEREQLRAAERAHIARAEQLAGELAELRTGELAQLRANELDLREQESALRERNACLKAEQQANRERIERLATELHAVYSSSSWRLTSPIRWLKRCLSFRIIRKSTLGN